MSLRSKKYLVCVAAFAMALAGVGAASGSPASVRVAGSRPAWARASNLVRRVDPASRVDFLVFLGWRDAAGVAAVASAVSDPNNASYGHYLSAAEFRARFSPAARGRRRGTAVARRRWAPGRQRAGQPAVGGGERQGERRGARARNGSRDVSRGQQRAACDDRGSSRPGGARRDREGVRRPVRRSYAHRHLEPPPEAPGDQERPAVQRVLGREGCRHPASRVRRSGAVCRVRVHARPAAERVRDERRDRDRG